MKLDTIHAEDCRETLSRMPSGSVDLVITSPPYNMNLRIMGGKYVQRKEWNPITTKYKEFRDDKPIEEYHRFHCDVLRELLRVSGLVFYNVQIVTGSKRSIFKMIGEFSDVLKEIIILDKGAGEPAIHADVLNRRSQLLLVFETDYPISRQFRTSAQFNRGALDDLWKIKRGGCGASFDTRMVSTILRNFSTVGQLVYDPFMGTGTTAVAAKQMGRHFIGSEIVKSTAGAAQQRVENATQLIFDLAD